MAVATKAGTVRSDPYSLPPTHSPPLYCVFSDCLFPSIDLTLVAPGGTLAETNKTLSALPGQYLRRTLDMRISLLRIGGGADGRSIGYGG